MKATRDGRFCINCRWHEVDALMGWDVCNVLLNDPVTGEPFKSDTMKRCRSLRSPAGPCGPEGLLWEAR